ncbi:MAG: SUMF1/EgtB/PvdO family nonheme iron enzyme, partial [Myxococcota bacterium]
MPRLSQIRGEHARLNLWIMGLLLLLGTGCSEFIPGCWDADKDCQTVEEGDCDDKNANIYLGAPEYPYDGVDQDCDGSDLIDVDGDGQAGKKGGGDDCNDEDAAVSAGHAELCDGKDNDCDAETLLDDGDGDGVACLESGKGLDCDDADADTYPNAPEIPYDGVDQDCDREDLVDLDNDGEPSVAAGGRDCNDNTVGLDYYNQSVDELEVYIPAGVFTMGWAEGATDEGPEHDVTLSAYCIDRYEVENVAYRACVEAGVCTVPTVQTSSSGRPNYYTDAAYDAYPVIGVTWDQAAVFCGWQAKRLPTEAQWEKAARGGHCLSGGTAASCPAEQLNPLPLRKYPWGDDAPTCEKANFNLGEENASCSGVSPDSIPVDSLSEGVSPYGVYQMSGNIAEWTRDFYLAEYYMSSPANNPTGPEEGVSRTQRGSSFNGLAEQITVTNRT